METTLMKMEYLKQTDNGNVLWRSFFNVDELIWNGKYTIKISDDDGTSQLPFSLGNDETVSLFVQDNGQKGTNEYGRTIVQTITRAECSCGKVSTYTRTRYNDGGAHVWSQWTAASEIPVATNTSLGGVIIGDGLSVNADGKVSVNGRFFEGNNFELSENVREMVERIPPIESSLLEIRGFSITASFQVPEQTNVKSIGIIELPATLRSGAKFYIKYTQNYTPGDKGIRFYLNSAVAANLVTPKRNGLIVLNQDCDRILVSTDCSESGNIDIVVYKENIVAESKRDIKILSIGNSFSQDAFSYLPYILENIAPDIRLTLGIAYYSGASLQQHLQLMDDASAVYKLDKWTWDTYRWNAVNEQTLKQCLENEAWNIVVFQQSSAFSGDYSTVSPYLNPLIKRVGETLVKPVKLAWLLTPSNKMDFAESESFYNSISDVAERVLQETPIDMLFPCGTAIQNARHTTLQVLGDVGNLLHSSLHLQEGIPCLTEAYVAAMVVARSLGNNLCSVYGETSMVDSEWLNGKFIPGTHGSPVGSTFENIRIAQIAAIAAIKKPFEVTDISYLDDV